MAHNPRPVPRVTLSYRRDDSAGIARLIFERLKPRYGTDSVFMDIDAIEFGEDYRERIYQALRQTDYLLVLIGPRWLGPTASGRNRINDANDPVRMEVERALDIGLRVVPILLENTPMPGPDDLPESLGRLPYLNAAEVTAGREFDGQIDRIIRFIDRTFAAVETRRAREMQEREQELGAAAAASAPVQARSDGPPPVAAPSTTTTRVAAVVALEPEPPKAEPVHDRPEESAAPSQPAERIWSRRIAVLAVLALSCVGVVIALVSARVFFSAAKAVSEATAKPTPAATPLEAFIPARVAAAVPAGFVVMYDRLGGLFWKVTSCTQTGNGAQVEFEIFNDYRATVNYEVALTKRADHPAASEWLSGRRHLAAGASPAVAQTVVGYTCGLGDLYAGLRNVRFGADRGPYVPL